MLSRRHMRRFASLLSSPATIKYVHVLTSGRHCSTWLDVSAKTITVRNIGVLLKDVYLKTWVRSSVYNSQTIRDSPNVHDP